MKLRLSWGVVPIVASALLPACAEMDYSPAPGYPPGPVSGEVSVFYDDLSPYGSWQVVPSYGEVWVPRVSPWWRPYTEGHWVLTDDGWTWIADEPWGWAPFHYGRWYFDARWGWAWVPGRVWAPAWVAWRSGDGYVGWAPLPPQVRWEGDVDFDAGGFDIDAYVAPEHWCFVEERYVTAPVIRTYLVPSARSVTYVRVTRNITHYSVVGDRIVNRGLDVSHVERVTQHAIPRYRIEDRPGPGATSASEGRVSIYRPVRRGAPVGHGAPPAATAATPPGPGGGETQATPRAHDQPRPSAPAQSPQEIAARQEAERHELERHQAEERARLKQLEDNERRQASQRAKSQEIKREHETDQRNLDKQQREQQEALARRQKEERKTATQAHARPREQPAKKDKDKDDKKK